MDFVLIRFFIYFRNFQREGLKYDIKVPTYLQGSTSLQVKRQKPIQDQDSNNEWINNVTSDEFKREFFNHKARVLNYLHLIKIVVVLHKYHERSGLLNVILPYLEINVYRHR